MKILRMAAGLNQSALARRIGRDQAVISRIECGLQTPTPAVAAIIAQVLGFSSAELFGDVVAEPDEKGDGDEGRRG